MKKHTGRILNVALFGILMHFFSIIAAVQGQSVPNVAFTEGKADKNLKSIARVNPVTQAMEMNVPLAGYPGRAGNSTPVGLSYSSKMWRMEAAFTQPRFNPNTQESSSAIMLVPTFAERSSAGWTSNLVAPRLEFQEEYYDINGFANVVTSATPPDHQPPNNCVGLPSGTSIQSCFLISSTTTCVGIILDGPTTFECTTTSTYSCVTNNVTSYAFCYGNPNTSPPVINNQYVKRVRLYMPNGASHEFRKDDYLHPIEGGYDFVGTFLSVDGTGMRLELGATGQDSVLYLRDGSRFIFRADGAVTDTTNTKFASEFIDANGNRTLFQRTLANGRITGTVTDTLGRVITDPLYQNQFVQMETGTQNIPLEGIDGAVRNQSLTWSRLEQAFDNSERQLKHLGTCENTQGNPINPDNQALFPTPANQRFNTSICGWSDNSLFNPVVLTEITIANGSKYKFKYNEYAEITEIEHPTGAIEKFEYGIVPQIGMPTTPAYSQANRGVTKHWIYERATAVPQLWQYINGETIAPDGSKIKRSVYASQDIQFGFDDPRAGMIKEERVYDTNGQLRSRILNDWVVTGPQGTSAFSGAKRDARLARTISMMFEGGKILATMAENEYETPGVNGVPTDPSYFAQMNVKQTKSYHYLPLTAAEANENYDAAIVNLKNKFHNTGQVATIGQTDYEYNTDYKARGIASLPIETRAIDPTNTSNILGKKQVFYDNQSPDPNPNYPYSTENYGISTATNSTYDCSNDATPKICWQNPNSAFLGRVTTSRVWNNDTDTWIESHVRYDIFGNAVKVRDAMGNEASTIFTANYKYAYPETVITPAPDPTNTTGTNQTSQASTTYDFMTGLPVTLTDDFGQTMGMEYNDSLLRPTKVLGVNVTVPVTETIYDDNALTVKVRSQIDEANWAEQTSFADKLGRVIKTQTKDLQGDVFAEVKYDNFGRVEKTSNPYRQGETVLWSKPRYDELGRVVESYAPAIDGQTGASFGTVEFGISDTPGFVGSFVVAKDASGRRARTISNKFGIIRVDEATAFGGATADADLGTLASPNQPTFYDYNIKGELVKITQGNPNQAGQTVQRRYFMYDSLGRLTRVRQPEQIPNASLNTTGNPDNNQWTAGYSYDIVGNVLTVTDANGVVITNTYDKAGRVKTRSYTNEPSGQITPTVSYFYDGKGLAQQQSPNFAKGALTKTTSSVSENLYTEFDNFGRLKKSQQVTDGNTYEFLYKYNLSGALVEETYPSGRVVRNFLDSDGGLAAVSSKAKNGQMKTVATAFDYSATGDVRKMMLGNGLWETAQFNERLQLTQIGLGTTPTNNNQFKIDYEYGELGANDAVDQSKNIGNIAKQTTTIPTTSFVQTYKYDALNRLTEAKEKTGSTQNWRQTFGYDKFGNRTSFTQEGNLPANPQPTIDPTNNRFTTGQGYVYDYQGNLIQDAQGRSFKFNGEDKQREVRNTSNNQLIGEYFYDGDGARVKKVGSGVTTVFVYDAAGDLAAEYSSQAPTQQTSTTSYLTYDHLGSPRVITNQQGQVTSRRDFMPFGEELGVGVGGRSESLKYSVTNADNIRQRFTGYEKDTETDLDFAQNRMYQNKHGRFTAVDPLMASARLTNPQTFNRYTYTGNNPINYTDPSGLDYYRDANGNIHYFPGSGAREGYENVTGQSATVTGVGPLFRAAGASVGDVVYYHKDSIEVIKKAQTNLVNETVEVVCEEDGGLIESVGAGINSVIDLIEEQVGNFTGGTTIPDVPTDWDWGPGGEGNPNSV